MATYNIDSLPAQLEPGDIVNCPYSGTIKSITLPQGTYVLDCWGGKGGNDWESSSGRYYYGGNGGYSTGTLQTSVDSTTLYLVCGGGLSGYHIRNGGYNGGGGGAATTSNTGYGSGGGGATHISTISSLLSARSSDFATTVLMVAGGGGGAGGNNGSRVYAHGGNGGGTTGNAGSGYSGKGGTQTAGGAGGTGAGSYWTTGGAGSFGQGGNAVRDLSYYDCRSGGGGGGLYGGGGGSATSDDEHIDRGVGGGGGGSGYINLSLLTTGSTSTEDTSTSPGGVHGYIRITVVSIGAGLNAFVKINVPSKTYLYNAGTISLVDGFSKTTYGNDYGSITFNTSTIRIATRLSGGGMSLLSTSSIDVTNYSRLCFKWSGAIENVYNASSNLSVMVGSTTTPFEYYGWGTSDTEASAIYGQARKTFTDHISSCDLSSITGQRYVFITIPSLSTANYADISEIWLESDSGGTPTWKQSTGGFVKIDSSTWKPLSTLKPILSTSSASILVTGLLSTDTVTCTGGYTATWTANGWLISGIKQYGTYTVTATRGSKTTTASVVVDSATEYTVAMSFVLYLYNEGDEGVSGGWATTSTYGSLTKNATNMVMTSTYFPGSAMENYFSTLNSVNLSQYSKICFDVTMANGTTQYAYMGVATSRTGSYSKYVAKNTNVRATHEVNISTLSDNEYGKITVCARSDYRCVITVHKVWLE